LDGDELISIAVEYPYGAQFWEDSRGVEDVCRCDSACNGSEIKTRIRMPFAFSNPRPVTEWTEEYVELAAGIPPSEKDEVIEYIRSSTCVKGVDAPKVIDAGGDASLASSGAEVIDAVGGVFVGDARTEVFTWSDDVGEPIEDVWKDDLAEVTVCA